MKRIFGVTIIAVGLFAACSAKFERTQNHAPQSKAPLGLWSWSADKSEEILSIALETAHGKWQGTLDSVPVAVTYDQGMVSVTGPDGNKFVGELAADKSEIRGYWLQPSSPLDYQDVATPIVLPAVADGQWQADMLLQPRPFRIFLDIFKDKDANITAVIRNPEGNNTLGASRFRLVADEGGGWTLVGGRGDRERRHDLEQPKQGELLLDYDRFDDPISLRPATDTLTAGYYSRQDQGQPARLTLVPQLDDGWVVAAPEEVGFNPAALQALTAELASTDPRNQRPIMIHSLLVARGGKLVFEEYFFGHDRETRHDVRSLGKVFGSVMVGAMQQQGYSIDAAHRPIPDILQRAGQPIDDLRKADITLGHLMTFTSGLDCDANSDSIGSETRMWEQQEEKDYWVYTAQLPMLHNSGERYAYCSGSANLVGASLKSVGAAPVYELFDRLIAKPLKFGPYHWALAPNGEGYLGGGAYMRPRDILKIGAMFAAGGIWNGKQVIDEDWVRESTTPKVAISAKTTGMTTEVFENNYFGGSQAYIWRVDSVSVGQRSYASYEASGNGGQLLIVVPDLDLTVVFTGGNYRMGGIWGRWRNEIVGGHIIPAMTDMP